MIAVQKIPQKSWENQHSPQKNGLQMFVGQHLLIFTQCFQLGLHQLDQPLDYFNHWLTLLERDKETPETATTTVTTGAGHMSLVTPPSATAWHVCLELQSSARPGVGKKNITKELINERIFILFHQCPTLFEKVRLFSAWRSSSCLRVFIRAVCTWAIFFSSTAGFTTCPKRGRARALEYRSCDRAVSTVSHSS